MSTENDVAREQSTYMHVHKPKGCGQQAAHWSCVCIAYALVVHGAIVMMFTTCSDAERQYAKQKAEKEQKQRETFKASLVNLREENMENTILK